MRDAVSRALGFYRSRFIYQWIPGRQKRMQRLYHQFIGSESLCFDIGSHLGNRVDAWRALGGTVVAVEPQSHFAGYLKRRFAHDPMVTILHCGLGEKSETKTLLTSPLTPTVASFNPSWVRGIGKKDPRFAGIRWSGKEQVKVTTLDALMVRFGEPDFCKIDVEGYEYQVLAGLSRPLRSLSFEYLPATMDETFRCIDRLCDLNPDYRFNFSKRETMRFVLSDWVDGDRLKACLSRLPLSDPSGDIYGKMGRSS